MAFMLFPHIRFFLVFLILSHNSRQWYYRARSVYRIGRIKTMMKNENASADSNQFTDELIQRVLKVRANKSIED